MDDLTPVTRKEKFYAAILGSGEELPDPVTREEIYLKEIAKSGGGGGGGESVIAWKPTVSPDGTISWTRTSSTTKPDDQNIKGEDGFSPTVTITPITGGHRVIITDTDGSHSFDVMDGGGDAFFVATKGVTRYQELLAAINAGKLILFKNNENASVITCNTAYRAGDVIDIRVFIMNQLISNTVSNRDVWTTTVIKNFGELLIAQENVTSGTEISAAVTARKTIIIESGNTGYFLVTKAMAISQSKALLETLYIYDDKLYSKLYSIDDSLWTVDTTVIGGSGDAVLTAALTASKTVGGITSGKQYQANTPLETLFRDMLNPVENPTLTAPSATLSASGGTLVEEGETTAKTLTVNFNRGSINPAYGTSGYRSGPATGYALNGGAQQAGNAFSVNVNDENKTFVAEVSYSAGEQPKNSAGENYGTPLEAGSVNTNTLTFEIVAALWSNAANITTIAKEALISKNTKLKQFNFPAQTSANPEVFDVPASWTVTAVELLNTLNNQWVNCASEFDVTDTTHGDIAYKRYTYNGGGATGARSVRIKWN